LNDVFKALETEYNQLFDAVQEGNEYRSHNGFIL
jgi:hypothetical protein